MYSIQDVHWNWIKIKGTVENVPSLGHTINYCSEKCYVFGQHYKEGEQVGSHKKPLSGMMILNVDPKEIDIRVNEFKYKPKISELGYLNCNECYEHQKSITKSKFSDFVILKEALSDKIEYVYSAFGLLVDNALILKAKDCRVVFHHTAKEKFCLIQDNGNAQTLWDNHNDFISDLMIIKTYV